MANIALPLPIVRAKALRVDTLCYRTDRSNTGNRTVMDSQTAMGEVELVISYVRDRSNADGVVIDYHG